MKSSTLVGIGVSILIAISGYFINAQASIETRVDSVTADGAVKGERLSSVETAYKSLDARLNRIEDKIDVLINAKK